MALLRLLKTILICLIGAVVIGFAVLNRSAVTFVYWPKLLGGAEQSVTLPLSALIMISAIAGVVVGGTATWLRQGAHRRAEREYRREAERLRSEAERLKAMQPSETVSGLPLLKSR
jgi:uncharacterized integral membrane protein